MLGASDPGLRVKPLAAGRGVVKQVPGTFKYYLSEFGRRLVIGSLALKEMTILPAIARAAVL